MPKGKGTYGSKVGRPKKKKKSKKKKSKKQNYGINEEVKITKSGWRSKRST